MTTSTDVAECVDILCDPFQRAKHKHAIAQLSKALEAGSGDIEEAVRANVAQLVTRLLPSARDDATLDAMARILAACSGPMACSGKVSTFTYGHISVHVKEGALSEGLGAKVWSLSHVLCRELVEHPHIVTGHHVLEIGSGTGLCGMVAAKLGSAKVLLTDHEGLSNLRTCMHMNTAAAAASTQQYNRDMQHAGGRRSADLASHPLAGISPQSSAEAPLPAPARPQLAAASVPSAEPPAVQSAADSPGWEAGNMAVRLLDWADSLAALDGCASQNNAAALPDQALHDRSEGTESAASSAPPTVPADMKFPVLLGNEVMYEPRHAELVAAVIAHRLAPHGKALLCCAVRQSAVFAHFARCCAARGLRHRAKQVAPPAAGSAGGGLLAHAECYEGGFLLIAVDHAAAPALDWHRQDWEDGSGVAAGVAVF